MCVCVCVCDCVCMFMYVCVCMCVCVCVCVCVHASICVQILTKVCFPDCKDRTCYFLPGLLRTADELTPC